MLTKTPKTVGEPIQVNATVTRMESWLRPIHLLVAMTVGCLTVVGAIFACGVWVNTVNTGLSTLRMGQVEGKAEVAAVRLDVKEIRARAEHHDGEDQKVIRNILKIGDQVGVKDLEKPIPYEARGR
jgi:hypothetical protein